MAPNSKLKRVRSKLSDFALALPETTEDFPWGERVVKVNKKVFAFLGRDIDAHFSLGVKLKASHAEALATAFTSPMGYGLGKSGWVSAKFEVGTTPSFELLKRWLLESYSAVAPKTLATRVASARPSPGAKRAREAGPAAKSKAALPKPAAGKAKSTARRQRKAKSTARRQRATKP